MSNDAFSLREQESGTGASSMNNLSNEGNEGKSEKVRSGFRRVESPERIISAEDLRF